MTPQIVVGYNGTDGSDDALSLAFALQDASDPAERAALTVVSFYPLDPPGFPVRAVNHEYTRGLIEDARARLAGAREASGERPNVSFVVRGGSSPAAVLHGLAEELDAETIVVGRSHTGPIGRLFLGSVTEQTLHGAPCSVAVAPLGYGERPQRLATVGVAVDGSPASDHAAVVGHQLADRHGAALRLMHVLPPLTTLGGGLPYAVEERTADAQLVLEAAADALGGGSVDTLVAYGEPAEVLAHPDQGIDLLVVGSRGFGPVQRVLLGSVSSLLARRCEVPLLVTRRPARTDERAEVAVGEAVD